MTLSEAIACSASVAMLRRMAGRLGGRFGFGAIALVATGRLF